MSGKSIKSTGIKSILWSLVLVSLAAGLIPSSAFAQLGKNLVFAQIAFGGGYEAVLNVTNRGTSPFNGGLFLHPSDRSKPFSVLVNGNAPVVGPLGNSIMSLTLNPGATASLRITSANASSGVLSGFATFGALNPDAEEPYLLEGNLTYYLKAADGTVVDSVGVAPSAPARQSMIPFDDFQTVALALANAGNQPATIRLTLFDDKNTQMGTATQPLAADRQIPKFLSQFFPGVSLTRGRVEIASDAQLWGTALTFAKSGQASSLPFLPPIKLYNVTINVAGETSTGRVYLRSEQGYVTGFYSDTTNSVPAADSITAVSGLTMGGNLEILVHDSGNGNIIDVHVPGFDPFKSSQSGTITVYLDKLPGGVAGQGTITFTAVN
jgi:hypothetical protein